MPKEENSTTCCGLLGRAVLVSAAGAAINALAGAVGAAVLSEAGYADYDAGMAARAGAAGGALITGALALCCGGADMGEAVGLNGVAALVADITVSGIVGQAMLDSAGHAVLSIGKQAAASAVGMSVSILPLACVCGSALVCCGVIDKASNDSKQYASLPDSYA